MKETALRTEKPNIKGVLKEGYNDILSPDALEFVISLHQRFNNKRKKLIADRTERQYLIDGGKFPDFLPETKNIRESKWTISPQPEDLQDRRVEITGPVDRKMIINALNSGAKVFMADFEDSNSPSWENNIDGQINLKDAVRKTIRFENKENGKKYKLNDSIATLMVRPRGWHLVEKNILVDGEPISASLLDFGLYFFHNTNQLIFNGSGPYFYLPKLENHLEARLWNDVFVFAQDELGIPRGTIKATVLIETILASFELHEILYELKEHSAGLNCGRWDYIFSYIKKFNTYPQFCLPDRDQVTMAVDFMEAYSLLVIKTCHERGAHAMGGMAAQIPIKNDPKANDIAIEKVRKDKLREVSNGHDGTWVAHPALVSVAMEVFDEHMRRANQIDKQKPELNISARDLIRVPVGTITEDGVRKNINVGILYIESWLRGNGAAAIYNLMEDAATAEISRSQLWQWIRHGALMDDGKPVTYPLYRKFIAQELEKIRAYVGEDAYENGEFERATALFDDLMNQDHFEEFLTLPAYKYI